MLPEGITPGPWDDSKDKGGTAAAFQRVTLGGAVLGFPPPAGTEHGLKRSKFQKTWRPLP